MVEPARTWTININQQPTNQLSQLSQFRELIYAWKVNRIAAGWTVTLSSDGDVGASAAGGGNAGAADYWTSAAVLGVDSTALGGAWIVLQAPATFVAAGGALYTVGLINDTDIVNPQVFQQYHSSTVFTGGTTTAIPTSAGVTTSLDSGNDEIINNTSGAAEPQVFSTWYSSRGDTLFMNKTRGLRYADYLAYAMSMEDGDGGGQGAHRFITGHMQDAEVTQSGFATAKGFNEAGSTVLNTGNEVSHLLSTVTSDHVDHEGNNIAASVQVMQDLASQVRNLGTLVDWSMGPFFGGATAAWGKLMAGEDSQTQRRVGIGQLYVYAPRLDLPFL